MFWKRKPDGDWTVRCLEKVVERLEKIDARLDALEKAQRETHRPVPHPSRPGTVAEWLPVLDRFQELALVAQGHPDLAQQFGIATRQKEQPPQVEWEEPEAEIDGITYG